MSPRVGLLWPRHTVQWTAGTLYFENLVKSLELAGHADDVVVVDAAGGQYGQAAAHVDLGVRSVTFNAPSESNDPLRVLRRQVRRGLGVPELAESGAVRRSGVDSVFGDVDPRTRYPVPWVGWIPDFQHLHLPQYFDGAEIAVRDRAYAMMADKAALVLLSSEDARRDFERFVPRHATKARVASFVSLMPDEIYDHEPDEVVERYHIPGPFVLVPNQWWRHKDHRTAIEAAALISGTDVPLHWVFTGALADYRDPSHVSELLQMIARLDLTDRIHILGVLPRSEQLQLMRAATAVVQPSLFEGWSTVVEDAKSLGQRVVASDIAVHREQAAKHASYFTPGSAAELAERLAALGPELDRRERETSARAETLLRAAGFGRRFFEICTEATASRRPYRLA